MAGAVASPPHGPYAQLPCVFVRLIGVGFVASVPTEGLLRRKHVQAAVDELE